MDIVERDGEWEGGHQKRKIFESSDLKRTSSIPGNHKPSKKGIKWNWWGIIENTQTKQTKKKKRSHGIIKTKKKKKL